MLEQVVDRLLARVGELYPGDVPVPVADAGEIARRGYLWRVAETETFAAARAPTPGLPERLHPITAGELARELADAEPLGRPDPGDPGTITWTVPGPGGHVRHYGALASIEAAGLADRALKREWLYGFLYRCCEEAGQARPVEEGKATSP
ncbi:hypothetical protein Gocc_0249 [Gaiella occulta]|uniref:Uncharacterized protein n=1 Tax=Gaiella occulta TaxID=1002870 RepID=A0A7M2Z0K3_9ACTN|nr:hypothetical protein [Gaiella occulta]RDI75830.1 hypothetical protein Gocc_0249 [Gaiella occulta]